MGPPSNVPANFGTMLASDAGASEGPARARLRAFAAAWAA